MYARSVGPPSKSIKVGSERSVCTERSRGSHMSARRKGERDGTGAWLWTAGGMLRERRYRDGGEQSRAFDGGVHALDSNGVTIAGETTAWLRIRRVRVGYFFFCCTTGEYRRQASRHVRPLEAPKTTLSKSQRGGYPRDDALRLFTREKHAENIFLMKRHIFWSIRNYCIIYYIIIEKNNEII